MSFFLLFYLNKHVIEIITITIFLNIISALSKHTSTNDVIILAFFYYLFLNIIFILAKKYFNLIILLYKDN